MARKRHKKTRGSRGTGVPSGKDRAAHEAARGVKQPSLRDLSRSYPTDEDFQEAIDDLQGENDRSAAMTGATLVDIALMNAIMGRLAAEPDLLDEWFHSEGGLFNTFARRTRAARALRIIGEKTEPDLDAIRTIRNQFAHTLAPLKFTHPTISHHCDKLQEVQALADEWPNLSRARRRYTAQCFKLLVDLTLLTRRDLAARAKRQLRIRKGLP